MEIIKRLLGARARARVIRNPLSWGETEEAIQMAWENFGEVIFPNYGKLYLLEGDIRLQVIDYLSLLNRGQCVERIELRRLEHSLKDYVNSPLELQIREFLEILAGPLVWAAGGFLVRQENCVWSELTDQYYLESDPDLVWVRCREDNQPLLEQEASAFAFWCCASHQYYCRRDFECIEVEGETFAAEHVIDDVFQWADGSFHWEPEPNLGLRQYHEGLRVEPQPGRRLSLELEVEVGSVDPTFGDAVRRVWHEAEEDSSLGPFGAELIVGFVPIETIEEKIQNICQILDRYDCQVPDNYYGFHISVSIGGWGLTEVQVEKLGRIFYSNQDLVCRIAKRQPNRFCKWQSLDRLDLGRSKYYALSRRDEDRLEFRIFKAETDSTHLLRCIKFVTALLDHVLSGEGEFTFSE